jgi:hypothetical protein
MLAIQEGLKGAFVYSVPYFLASALIAMEHWKRTALGRKRIRYWRIFRKNHNELRSWVAKGNPNTRHLVYLLDAALLSTRRSSTTPEVQHWYDKSIAAARRAGFVHDAALANELAGQYFLESTMLIGLPTILRRRRHCLLIGGHWRRCDRWRSSMVILLRLRFLRIN